MVKRRYTLEEIRQKQEVLQREVEAKQKMVRKYIDNLVSPEDKPLGFTQRWTARAMNFSYIIDGALLGYKLYRLTQKKKPALLRRKK